MALESILIDQREPTWAQSLTFGGVPALVTLLDAADYICATDDGSTVAIERKEANDFLNTLRSDRLFPQLARLRDVTPWAYLALSGSLLPGAGGKCFVNGIETGWNWASVSGALLTVQELGVHVVQIAGDHDFEAAVLRLCARDRANLRIEPARDIALISDAEAILTALPGIGPEKAAALIEYCGTAAWALACLTDTGWPGPSAPGIGNGLRLRARKALGLGAAEYLWPIGADQIPRSIDTIERKSA